MLLLLVNDIFKNSITNHLISRFSETNEAPSETSHCGCWNSTRRLIQVSRKQWCHEYERSLDYWWLSCKMFSKINKNHAAACLGLQICTIYRWCSYYTEYTICTQIYIYDYMSTYVLYLKNQNQSSDWFKSKSALASRWFFDFRDNVAMESHGIISVSLLLAWLVNPFSRKYVLSKEV